MKHLGDITKISGYDAPTVDVIVGGSPCQDLSMAGKRAGLDGERSGLFMEQIRIIKEMRDNDVQRNGRTGVNVRPRYMVWENVPGAFSSNKGEDFRIVLEETAKIADENAVIPRPADGKWRNSGCIVGNGWSIAWRVLDAQFWGVPQRRRRIALVADFGGESASEILFISQSVSGYTDKSQPQRENPTADSARSTGADDCLGADQYNAVILGDTVSTLGVNCGMSHGRQCVLEPKTQSAAYTMKVRSGCEVDSSGKPAGKGALIQTEKSGTLSCVQDQYLFQPVYSIENHPADSRVDIDESGKVQTLTSRMGTGGGNVPMVMESVFTTSHGSFHTKAAEGVADTLMSTDYKDPPTAVYAVDCRNGTENEVNNSLQSAMAHNINSNNVVRTKYTVRRLTPLECERLQGYPDGWTDIGEWEDTNGKVRRTSDANRYKALGNSIALPPWKWVMKRISACYERDATLASLFDGIGGFPYIWEQINGKGSCLWASEIEEFPIAVTKKRIGGKL